jgi:Rieske Fe-S protein
MTRHPFRCLTSHMSSRRDFLAGAGKVLLAGLALPVIQSCVPTSAPIAPTTNNSIPIGPDGTVSVDVSDLSASNPFKIIPGLTGPDGFGVMVTLDNDTYHALSQRCTHAGCPVNSQLAGGHIHCSCHGSDFALNGAVLSPPATQPLIEYSSTLNVTSHLLKIKIV